MSVQKLTTVLFTDEKLNGKVVMRTLPGRERLLVLKEIKLTPDSNGVLAFNDNTIDALIKGTEIVEKYIEQVELIVNEEVITTFSDLEYSNAFNTVIMKLIGTLLNGPDRLGK